MSQVIYSYALSVAAKSKVGITPADNLEEAAELLDQRASNILEGAKLIKFNSFLAVGSPGEKTYDLRDYGINYIRSITIKVVDTVDPLVVLSAPIAIRATLNGQTISGKTLFLDFADPVTLPVPTSSTAINLILHNTNAAPIIVSALVVGY